MIQPDLRGIYSTYNVLCCTRDFHQLVGPSVQGEPYCLQVYRHTIMFAGFSLLKFMFSSKPCFSPEKYQVKLKGITAWWVSFSLNEMVCFTTFGDHFHDPLWL